MIWSCVGTRAYIRNNRKRWTGYRFSSSRISREAVKNAKETIFSFAASREANRELLRLDECQYSMCNVRLSTGAGVTILRPLLQNHTAWHRRWQTRADAMQVGTSLFIQLSMCLSFKMNHALPIAVCLEPGEAIVASQTAIRCIVIFCCQSAASTPSLVQL